MNKKDKENKEKWVGGCYNLLVVNRQRRKDFCFGGNGGFGSYGNGTPTQAAAIWNHGTDRKHILGPLQLLPNLLEWKSHCDARARTWTEDIVAVHVTCIAAAI